MVVKCEVKLWSGLIGMWKDLGFKENLYDTHPVSADDRGERLLVGRIKELKSLKNRISGFRTVTTVEGPNGVGKTSVVLVGAFQLERETSICGKKSILLLPKPFQLTTEESAVEFKRRVYEEIASHFIKNESKLRTRLGFQIPLNGLADWLQKPMFLSGSVSLGGFGAGLAASPNGSAGFDAHGFFNIVDQLLEASFDESGGIVCIIDNLEILNTSQAAREKLEALRDDLFAKHGIRWVVCGARGIVRSVASSQRLHGRLQDPIEIAPLDVHAIDDLVKTRVLEFRMQSTARPPVDAKSFRHAFEILNQNLRDTLKFCGDFSLWLGDNPDMLEKPNELTSLFEAWMAEQSEKYSQTLNVPPRAWKLFDEICERGGSISPSDHEEFGFKTSQNMRGQVHKLEQAALVNSEIDDSDHRRKVISVVAKGWLVRYHRSDYKK